VETPQTRYARSGETTIAYQVAGNGPIDLLLLPGLISHVEHLWEEPGVARFLERLTRFSRLILMDRRGTGLSDPVVDPPRLDDELADITAVLDAVGSDRAALFGYTTAAPSCIMYAARCPDRVGALVLYAAIVRAVSAPDYPWAHTRQEREQAFATLLESWGSGDNLDRVAPSVADDRRLRAWLARFERLSASPGQMATLIRNLGSVDVRDELAGIRVPTLLLHRTDDSVVDVRHSRYLAEHVAGAHYVELPGRDNLMTVGDTDGLLLEIERFLTGGRRGTATPQRRLLTVLFTDVVDATTHAARIGDGRWRDLLAEHDRLVRRQLERFDGREVKTIGDAFLAVFDGAPSEALRCAGAIVDALHGLGLQVRAGLHTGECELIGEDVGGMAVHIAARVSSLARPGEVLASGTAYGTVAGSSLRFKHRGTHVLRGVPGEWPLFALAR
jgi:class 3 adenylate cyclase/alpha-beta hydrolase superfamily lysophospholipase